VAIARSTSRRKGQKINACCISVLQGRLFPSDKEEDGHAKCHIFCFSLSSFLIFHLFTTNVTPSPFLRSYKRGGRGHILEQSKQHTYSLLRYQHTRTTPQKRPGIHFFSRKLITPTTSTPVQGNTSNIKTHWTQGHSCPNQYASLYLFYTPSRPRRADTNLLVALFRSSDL
jgi:hypothetical protein